MPTGVATISGSLVVGQTLTADASSIGDVDGMGTTFSYQWSLDGAIVSEATGVNFILTQEHVGKKISVDITYTDGGGTSETVSAAETSPVINALPDVSKVSVLTNDGTSVDIDAAQNKLEWQLDSDNPQANGTFKLEKSDPLFSLFGLNADDVPEGYNAQKISVKIGAAVNTIGIDPIKNTIAFEILQDLDGDGSHDAGERSITASFEIERTGDGQQETWEAKAGGVVTLNVTGQSGTTAQVTLINHDSDQMVFDVSNNGTIVPDSWVSKLSDAKSIIESEDSFDGLSFPNMQAGDDYIVKMTVSDENNTVSQQLLSIDINVIENMPDISTVSVMDSDGVTLHTDDADIALQWELDVPPVNEGTITLQASDPLFSLFGLNSVSDVDYQKMLLVEISDAVDTTNTGPIVNSLVLEIIQDLNENGSYDDGDRSITASFDIERTGDGQQETWKAKAGEDVTFNFKGQSGTEAEVTLTNNDSDQIVFDDTNAGTFVPDSWISKLSDAKSIIESDSAFDSLSFPNVQADDDYIVKLSMLDNVNDVSVDILSLNIDIL